MTDSDFRKFRLAPTGRLLYAPVTPMLGGNVKTRPVVLLSLPNTNDPDAEFRVACGSSTPPDDQNKPFAIKVVGRPGGHRLTGLENDTWFYAGWIRTLKVKEVDRFCGEFPAYAYEPLLDMIEEWTKQNS